jgi:hypothetical protein
MLEVAATELWQAPSEAGKQEEVARDLLGALAAIPGVLRVETPKALCEDVPCFKIYVRSRQDEAGERVRELEGRLLDEHPDVSLDLWLVEEPEGTPTTSARAPR